MVNRPSTQMRVPLAGWSDAKIRQLQIRTREKYAIHTLANPGDGKSGEQFLGTLRFDRGERERALHVEERCFCFCFYTAAVVVFLLCGWYLLLCDNHETIKERPLRQRYESYERSSV